MVNLIFHFNLYTFVRVYFITFAREWVRESEREPKIEIRHTRERTYVIRVGDGFLPTLILRTLLSTEWRLHVHACVYIYIYIFTRCNGCRCIPRTHRRNGHHSNDEAISRCSISVLSHGKNLYSLFTSIPRFHPFSTGNCIAVLRTFEWRPLDYVKTRQDIPLVKQQNYPIIA